MMDAVEIAGVFASLFRDRFHAEIDEMKLHKMLYLAQRESLIRTHRALFSNEICAWRFGPVVVDVREAIRNDRLPEITAAIGMTDDAQDCVRAVFETYADKSSWSLSRLTHAEYSWRHARESARSGGGHRVIPVSDIAKDADRVRMRREALHSMGLG